MSSADSKCGAAAKMNASLKAVCSRDTMQCRSPRWSGKPSVHAVITAELQEDNRFGASARLARVMLELLASATSSSSPGLELCSVALVLDCRLTNLTSSNSKTLLTYRKSTVRAWAQLAKNTPQCAFRSTSIGLDGSCDVSQDSSVASLLVLLRMHTLSTRSLAHCT